MIYDVSFWWHIEKKEQQDGWNAMGGGCNLKRKETRYIATLRQKQKRDGRTETKRDAIHRVSTWGGAFF